MKLAEKHKVFNKSKRKHILIITNHGCHAPVIKVTRDTGGQNFYVNDLSKAFLRLGYKVTILNRGGYKHPVTKKLHKGIVYYGHIWKKKGPFCRLIYLEDNIDRFIKKENLTEKNLIKERDFFLKTAKKINLDLKNIYFITSHYWDAGILGILINEKLDKKLPHVWTPHSLGILKRERYKNASKKRLKELKFPFRIKNEEKVISEVDGVVSTSGIIQDTLAKYKSKVKNHFWFPPGIDTKLYRPRKCKDCVIGLDVLKKITRLSEKEITNLIRNKVVFLEVSRTSKTKRKELVLKAFSKIKNKDSALLIMTLDDEGDIDDNIRKVYDKVKDKCRIILIEKIIKEEEMAQIFSLANVYVLASVMEGWGMAMQQAAASRNAIISSKFTPFAVEVLKENCLIVHKNTARLYAEKMDTLIEEPNLREKLASKAHKIIKKRYSWSALSKKLMKKMKKKNLL